MYRLQYGDFAGMMKGNSQTMDKITFVTTIVGSVVAIATLVNAVWQYRRKVHLEIFRIYADK